ncbi:MAG: chemotaxis protein CheW [Comamonas sp.]|uniref:chemotaxis protein CheW n=1 Tax=Comamonas sp. TaxID=34028 RepID=UPI002FC6F525
MHPSRSPTSHNRYAMVRMAGVTLAVSVGEVSQAMPFNGAAGHLPRSERPLVGVLHHQGKVVPVVDLACWGSLRQAGEAAIHAQVLILQHCGRMTAIAIERTVGIAVVGDGAVQRVHHETAAHELFHSVLKVDGCEYPIPLLDTAHVMQQTQVWVQEQALERPASDAPPAARSATEAAGNACTETYVVAELQGLRFALPVQAIGSILQTPPIQKLPQLAKGLQGAFTWGRRNIPVVRIHHELGMALPPADSPMQAWLMVVRTESAALGVLVDRLVAVQRFASSRLQPAITALVTEVAPDPGDAGAPPIQLLSAAALLSAFSMSAIGAASPQPMQAPAPEPARTSPVELVQGRTAALASKVAPEAYLIIEAGRTVAARLKSIQHIAMCPPAGADDNLPEPTHFPWRGKLVPLLDLRRLTDGMACIAGPEARVLIMQEGEALTALVVEAVLDLVPALAGSIISLRLNHGRSLDLLTCAMGDKQCSYEVVDLGSIRDVPKSMREM